MKGTGERLRELQEISKRRRKKVIAFAADQTCLSESEGEKEKLRAPRRGRGEKSPSPKSAKMRLPGKKAAP